jgi:hypothetical protein
MPEGLEVTEAYEDGEKPAAIKWLRVEGSWEYDTRDTAAMARECRELCSHSVEVLRRTKRGEGMFTLTDHIRNLTFTPEGEILRVEALVSCAEPVVNPELITAAVTQNLPEAAPDGGHFCRLALYKADDTPFR